MNPNPGERTADMAWERQDYQRALSVIRTAAERGQPWAQLRLGVAYELGVGVAKDTREALAWYRKAARQTAEGGWAEGRLVGAMGRPGYFNQNSDALIAQHQIAGIYFRAEGVTKDLAEAYLYAKNVAEKTQGRSLFYCCEFSRARYITAEAIAESLSKIEGAMTSDDRKRAEERRGAWTP
ncbi:MAG: sel1 repeat family protein [Candidatus Rokubacteria bacterium]|nr:sel1 repeat family protein [Candidatus Rokubacteria bacterium]